MLHRRFLILVAALLAFAPSTAFAASATQDAYAPEETEVDNTPPEDSDVSPSTDSSPAQAAPTATGTSSLPFTGMEAGMIAIAGLGLAGTGVALRRVGREQG